MGKKKEKKLYLSAITTIITILLLFFIFYQSINPILTDDKKNNPIDNHDNEFNDNSKNEGILKDFDTYLTVQGFPDSYKPYLTTLHNIYPEWTFIAHNTGLDWNTVIYKESILGVNTVYYTRPISWKSKEKGAYDSATGSFIPMDTYKFVAASKDIVSYFMDPRNFLKPDHSIFQFEALNYNEKQNTEGIKAILKGSFMDNEDYYRYFLEAGKANNISPYFLAARALQELSPNGSNASSGSYPNYEGYFNYYNIGASPNADGSGAMVNGLIKAKSEGWTSPELSIMGGASFIGNNYIKKGQNTLYYQKFNVVYSGKYGLFTHQYMTNIEAPFSESKSLIKIHKDLNTPITFYIPIYNNMPDSPAPKPS